MNKYKIVGIINILFGIPQLLISSLPLFIVPKLSSLYTDFNVKSQQNFISGYIVAILIFAMAMINLFLGVKGFTKSKKKEKYFKYGIISASVTFFLTGILVLVMVSTVILPIYSLTSQY